MRTILEIVIDFYPECTRLASPYSARRVEGLPYMTTLLLFIFGLAVGSFVNVIALRYDPDRGFFAQRSLRGRSKCMQCAMQLRWFELIPLCSFLVLRGKCRSCGIGIALQYPLVEIAGGLIALAPLALIPTYVTAGAYVSAAIWTIALYILLFITLVDLRLRIIPDGANLALGFLGLLGVLASKKSALGYLAIWLGVPAQPIASTLLGGLVGIVLFGAIVIYTSGRGMGLGDVKLAIALGLLFGYPDVLLVFMLAFTLGAIGGVLYMIANKATLNAAIPFGPFLALGGVITLFYGERLLELYLRAFGL